jgi:hypothetical protein
MGEYRRGGFWIGGMRLVATPVFKGLKLGLEILGLTVLAVILFRFWIQCVRVINLPEF